MAKSDDLVHETSTTTGTGDFTLTNKNGRQSFNDAFGTGGTDLFYYYIANAGAAEWEFGTAHLSASSTLVRDTVIDSSNSGSLVNFSAGTKDVTSDFPAQYQPPVYQSDTQPDNAPDGSYWERTTDGKMFRLYDDGTTRQWRQATSGGGSASYTVYPSYTFSTIPSGLATVGRLVVVTDSNTTTWGATIAGSGANTVLAWYNGSNWTVVGS